MEGSGHGLIECHIPAFGRSDPKIRKYPSRYTLLLRAPEFHATTINGTLHRRNIMLTEDAWLEREWNT
jgi:hypothetical protein